MCDERIALNALIANLIPMATGSNSMDQVVLMMLVYLCDWHSCVRYGRRFTEVIWRVSRRALSDDGLESYVRANTSEFTCDDIANTVVSKATTRPELPEGERAVVERVCLLYREKMDSGLATFVMSTYPILSSSSDLLTQVDLLEKAREYLDIRRREA